MKGRTLFFFLLLFLQLPSIFTVQYKAVNYAGSQQFEAEIGIPNTLQVMQAINYFIWDIFKQYADSDRKQVDAVNLIICEYDGAEAITYGNTINVSSIYLAGYKGDIKWEFTSLLHHEMTHVFQWTGEGHAPVGLVEGMADYMILKSNYYPLGFAKRGQGERWDQGYDVTARFLEYCEELRSGFVAGLNERIRYDYREDYFEELTEKTVAELWAEYKAKYGM